MDLKNLATIAITFLVVAVILSVSATILSNFEDVYVETVTRTVNNETITTDGVVFVLDIQPFIGDGIVISLNNASGFYMTNGTNMSIGSNNYLFFNNGSGIFKNETGGMGVSTAETFNFSYQSTIDKGTVEGNATQYGNISEEELGSWLPTIAIIIAAAIIIGIIVMYFKFT